MTQSALAAELGVSRITVIRWESGLQSPPVSVLDTLACVLDCKPEDLVAAKPIIRAEVAPTLPPAQTPGQRRVS